MRIPILLAMLAILFNSFTQLRILSLGIGIGELFGMSALISAAINQQKIYINYTILLLLSGYFFGLLIGTINNELMGGISIISIRELFAVIYAVSISLLLATYIKKDFNVFINFLLVFDTIIISHISVIVLPFMGIDFPYWMGDTQEETVSAPLSFNGRFVGLAQNPHQIGILLTTYFMFMFVKRGEGRLYKLFHILATVAAVALILLIKSTTLIFVYTVITLVCLILIFKRLKIVTKFFAAFLLFIFCALTYVYVEAFFIDILTNDGKSDASGRFGLWENALRAVLEANFLGLGPGSHTGYTRPYEGTEAHNVFLDILMQGGVLSLFFYLFIYISTFIRNLKNKYILWALVLVALMLSQMSGYFLRNIFAWIPIFIALVWSSSHQNSLKMYFNNKS